jgi:hypothetical protein
MSDNPQLQLAQEINSLQSSVNSLQDDVRLASLRNEIATIDNSTGGLPQQIVDLRGRGYVFENDLEVKALGDPAPHDPAADQPAGVHARHGHAPDGIDHDPTGVALEQSQYGPALPGAG